MDYINYINNAKSDEEFIELFRFDSPHFLMDSNEYFKKIMEENNCEVIKNSKYYNYIKGIIEDKNRKKGAYLLKKYFNLNIKLPHLFDKYHWIRIYNYIGNNHDKYKNCHKYLYYYKKYFEYSRKNKFDSYSLLIYNERHNYTINLNKNKNKKYEIYKIYTWISLKHFARLKSFIKSYILFFILKKCSF